MGQELRNGGIVLSGGQGQICIDGGIRTDQTFADCLADQGSRHGLGQGTNLICMLFRRKNLGILPINGKRGLPVPDDTDGDPGIRFALGGVVQRILKGQTGNLSHLDLPINHQSAKHQRRAQHNAYHNKHNSFLSAFH